MVRYPVPKIPVYYYWQNWELDVRPSRDTRRNIKKNRKLFDARDRHSFDTEPDPTLYYDADPYPDSAPEPYPT